MSRFGAIFVWHFRRERLRMAALGLAAGVFVALLLGVSNSIRPVEVQELLDRLPPAFRAMVGMNEGEMFDLSRWLGLIYNHPVWLILILSFPLASALRGIAGGVDDGTLEIVLGQPLSRSAYYLALAAVVVLGTTWVLACSMLGGLFAQGIITLPEDIPAFTLFELSVSGWALAFSVAGISLLVSVVTAGGGRPVSTAVGIVVAMFFLRFLSDVLTGAGWLRWFSVFGYHDSRQLVSEGLAAGQFLTLLAVGLVCLGIGLAAFRRKQLTF